MNKVIWPIYKLLVIVMVLASFHMWIFWDVNENIFCWILFLLLSLGFTIVLRDNFYRHKYGIVWFVLLSISIILSSGGMNVFGVLAIWIPSIPVLFVALLKPELKENLLDSIIMVLACIFFISSVAWVFHIFGYDLPYYMVPHGTNTEDGSDQSACWRSGNGKVYAWYIFECSDYLQRI